MLRFLPKLVVGLKGKSAKSDPLLNLLTASLGTHFKESNSLLTSKEIKIENVDLPKATLDQINAILPDGTQINEVKISDVTVKVTSLKQALGNALSNMPFRIVIGNVRVTLALTPDVSAPSPAAADGATPAANGATAAAAADTASSAGGLFANEKIAQALRGVFKGLRIEVRRVMLRVIVRTRGTSTDGRRAQNHSYCLSIALRRLAFVSTDAGGKEVTSKDAEIFEDSARARADAAKAKKRRASGFGARGERVRRRQRPDGAGGAQHGALHVLPLADDGRHRSSPRSGDRRVDDAHLFRAQHEVCGEAAAPPPLHDLRHVRRAGIVAYEGFGGRQRLARRRAERRRRRTDAAAQPPDEHCDQRACDAPGCGQRRARGGDGDPRYRGRSRAGAARRGGGRDGAAERERKRRGVRCVQHGARGGAEPRPLYADAAARLRCRRRR